MLDQHIEPLDRAVREEAQRDKMALLLQTQPGVGAVTALAYVLTIGDVSRFARGKQVASHLGLIPREHAKSLSTFTGGGDLQVHYPSTYVTPDCSLFLRSCICANLGLLASSFVGLLR